MYELAPFFSLTSLFFPLQNNLSDSHSTLFSLLQVAVTDPGGRVIQRVESNPKLFGPRRGSSGPIRSGGGIQSFRDLSRRFGSRRKRTHQAVEMTPVRVCITQLQSQSRIVFFFPKI